MRSWTRAPGRGCASRSGSSAAGRRPRAEGRAPLGARWDLGRGALLVGYGPRTRAWLLKLPGAEGPLPGVLALHGPGGSKFYGKERIADGTERTPPIVSARRSAKYGSRDFANELAREGFIVLAHDAFLWGRRRFPLEDMPEPMLRSAGAEQNLAPAEGVPEDVALYDSAAHHHEHLVEKYCRLLGTTLAGVVAREDRVAASYLLSGPDLSEGSVGCVGLSGGGCRSALLQATCDRVSAAVVVGMMRTYEGPLDGKGSGHIGMFFPDGWACYSSGVSSTRISRHVNAPRALVYRALLDARGRDVDGADRWCRPA